MKTNYTSHMNEIIKKTLIKFKIKCLIKQICNNLLINCPVIYILALNYTRSVWEFYQRRRKQVYYKYYNLVGSPSRMHLHTHDKLSVGPKWTSPCEPCSDMFAGIHT